MKAWYFVLLVCVGLAGFSLGRQSRDEASALQARRMVDFQNERINDILDYCRENRLYFHRQGGKVVLVPYDSPASPASDSTGGPGH